MKTKTLIRSAVAGLIAAAGLAVAASGASAGSPKSATTLPSSALGTIALGSGPLPASGQGVKVNGTCPDWLFSDPGGITFTSGNAVLYQPDSGPVPGAFGLPPFDGGNVEGNATLSDVADPTQPAYVGRAHLWYGLTYSPVGNQQFYFGETLMFKGSGPAGTISLNMNPGFVVSASGHTSGWGQFDLTCSS